MQLYVAIYIYTQRIINILKAYIQKSDRVQNGEDQKRCLN